MGNNCVGPSAGGRCFFQSVSAALYPSRNTGPGGSLPASKSRSTNESAKNESAQKPPEPVKIPEDEIRMAPPLPVPSPSQSPPAPMEMQRAVEANKQSDELSEESKQAKERKHHFVKRMRSAGLQTDSVLQRETGKLKDVYSLGRKLGQGQFGTTYLCIEKATGKEFACKSIAKRKLLTPEDVGDVRREIHILHHLAGHPNIISIVDAYEDAVAVHVVMELCAGGELFDRIIQKGHYTEKAAAELARVIVGVVEACHSLGVMHRDLKPENFLFVNQMESSLLKMIDFGLSIFFKPGLLRRFHHFSFGKF